MSGAGVKAGSFVLCDPPIFYNDPTLLTLCPRFATLVLAGGFTTKERNFEYYC
jgi:hypothetical protein